MVGLPRPAQGIRLVPAHPRLKFHRQQCQWVAGNDFSAAQCEHFFVSASSSSRARRTGYGLSPMVPRHRTRLNAAESSASGCLKLNRRVAFAHQKHLLQLLGYALTQDEVSVIVCLLQRPRGLRVGLANPLSPQRETGARTLLAIVGYRFGRPEFRYWGSGITGHPPGYRGS